MESVGPILPAVAALAIALWATWWHFSRSRSLLQKWAEEHGHHILGRDYCFFFKGPFFWTTSRSQAVYYVTVEDHEGRLRRGWVRCGGWFLGLLSHNVEVRWDD